MIYKYDDIVKNVKEEYRFVHLSRKYIGKCITVNNEDSGTVFGGVIRQFYKNNIIFEYTMITNDYCETATKCLTAEELFKQPRTKVCIYDPSSGEHEIYKPEELVWHIGSERKFNTDILIPGAEFFMEADGKCGIVKVLDCGKDRVLFTEEGFIDGIRHFSIEETSYDLVIPNPIQLKTLDELTSFDLFKRGFNGDYKLRASTIAKIKDILDEEDKSDDE